MGATGAQGFAEAVDEGQVSLESALSWHLTANHFPPLPTSLIPVAVEAIQLASADIWDEDIDLPDGSSTRSGGASLTYKDQPTITVCEAVESMHLDSFIQSEEL